MLSTWGLILFFIISTELMLFFVMNGSDFGAGMATVFVHQDKTRSEILRVPSPVWFGNETWFVVGMGIMFATFPHWYAGITSGYFLVFISTLVFLILRGAAFELRLKWKRVAPNAFWNFAMIAGSLLPPFLLGMVFSSTLQGVSTINATIRPDVFDSYIVIQPSFFDIVTPFSVWTGIVLVLLSLGLGLTRVIKYLEDDNDLKTTLSKKLKGVQMVTLLAVAVETVLLYIYVGPVIRYPFMVIIWGIVVLILLGLSIYLYKGGKFRGIYWILAIGMGSAILLLFWNLYPNAINSSNGMTLTLAAAAGGAISQRTVLIGVAILLPLMIIGQVLAYYFQIRKYNVPDTDINV